MPIVDSILSLIFPHHDIQRQNGDLYLRRWFIWPRNKEFKKLEPRLYLHKFYRGDEDPHMHDHPWSFTSLILTRGYWEETPLDSLNHKTPYRTEDNWTRQRIVDVDETGEFRRQLFYPRFTVLRRPAVHKHRVVLKDKKPVWTIVRTGVKERSWGFWIGNKLCPWRKYSSSLGICDEGFNNTETAVED
jgi:hypothetical protein